MKVRHSGVSIILSISCSDKTDYGVLRMLLVIYRAFYDNINDSVLNNKY